MKKKNKNILISIVIIVALLSILTSTFLLIRDRDTSQATCFPDVDYLCEEPNSENAYFFCDIDNVVKCDNGCKVTKFGDDRCIR